jgi:hypothetical protein
MYDIRRRHKADIDILQLYRTLTPRSKRQAASGDLINYFDTKRAPRTWATHSIAIDNLLKIMVLLKEVAAVAVATPTSKISTSSSVKR